MKLNSELLNSEKYQEKKPAHQTLIFNSRLKIHFTYFKRSLKIGKVDELTDDWRMS